MWFDSQSLTAVWGVMMAGSIVWLLFAVGKTKKEETNKQQLTNL